ncbi:MAG TPA: MotA/TolQ/ExbB proton channel family protein [Solirubrobacteraceae bacterium]|jgi:biopolymer transport protein ExbB/TolQ|nr:MotA/TolQ/ExbB proton channel family protein [Solirubrobacteraceae bacterium]
MSVERVLSHIAKALRIPVLVLAIIALALVVAELGALLVDVARRHRRSLDRLERQLAVAQIALKDGDRDKALAAMHAIALTPDMDRVLTDIVNQLPYPEADERIAKRLADYEYRHLRRLERTRILVRFGPALGLMGTLIPLSPALGGLAHGNVSALTSNLQVAFSVTVAGLLVGALAFSVSLVRDRLYGQDYSDVQYIAATLTGEEAPSWIDPGAPTSLQPPGPAQRT